jgi:hypothetical protein
VESNYSIKVEEEAEEESRKQTACNKTEIRMSTEIHFILFESRRRLVGISTLYLYVKHRVDLVKFIVVFSGHPHNRCNNMPTSNEVMIASFHTLSSLLFNVMV